MPIPDRNAVVDGTVLVVTYKGANYRCEVHAGGEQGKLLYRLDGQDYTSPSAAGSVVMRNSCNGWRFWNIEGQEPAPRERKPRGEGTPRAPRPAQPKTVLQIKKLRAKRTVEVPEGQTQWHCSACMAKFLHEAGEEPETCPQGHPRRVPADEFAEPAPADAVDVRATVEADANVGETAFDPESAAAELAEAGVLD